MRFLLLSIVLYFTFTIVGGSCHRAEIVVEGEEVENVFRLMSFNYFDADSPDELSILLTGDTVEARISKSFLTRLDFHPQKGDILTIWPSIEQRPVYMQIDALENRPSNFYFYGSIIDISQILSNVDVVLNTKPFSEQPANSKSQEQREVLHPSVLHVSPECLRVNGEMIGLIHPHSDGEFTNIHNDLLVIDMARFNSNKSSVTDMEIVFQGNEIFKCNSADEAFNNNVGTDVRWSFNPYASISLSVSPQRELNQFKTLFTGEYEIESDINIVNSKGACHCEQTDINLSAPQSYHAIFMVGDVPVVIDVTADIVASVDIELDKGVDLQIPVKFTGSYSTGMQFEHGRGWNSIRESIHQTQHPDDLQFANISSVVNLKASTSVILNLKTRISDIGNFEASLGPTLNLGISTIRNMGGSLDFDAYGNTSFDVAISSDLPSQLWTLSPWATNYELYSKNLFTDRWSFPR